MQTTQTQKVNEAMRNYFQSSMQSDFEVANNFIMYSVLNSKDPELKAIADEYGKKWRGKLADPETMKSIIDCGFTEVAALLTSFINKQSEV